VGENEAKEVIGFVAEYTYPSYRSYVLQIHSDVVDFNSPWPGEKNKEMPVETPPKNAGQAMKGMPYKARKIKEGYYLFHWQANYQIHVGLVLDFEEKRCIAAGLAPNKSELWDVAYWDRGIVPPGLKKYEMKG
jgi:hypothetical protein